MVIIMIIVMGISVVAMSALYIVSMSHKNGTLYKNSTEAKLSSKACVDCRSGDSNTTELSTTPGSTTTFTVIPPEKIQIPLLSYCSRTDERCFNKQDFCHLHDEPFGEPVSVMCFRTIVAPDVLKHLVTPATVKPFTKKAKSKFVATIVKFLISL
jgi:hypothetical protein